MITTRSDAALGNSSGPAWTASVFTVKLLAMLTRRLQLPDRSFLLLGPRGTGKTTWLRERLPSARWYNLLLDREAFLRYLAPVRKKEWVVYSKPPFAGPQQVLDYLGRYTHRVAISNDRLLDIEDGEVRLRWKDCRDHNRQKTMTLKADEFIRRFLLHVLPDAFQRIRYFGFLGNRYRKQKLARCRKLLDMPEKPACENSKRWTSF